MRLEQLLLADLSTGVRYEDGRLNFTDLSMRWLDRRLAANQLSNEASETRRSQNAGLNADSLSIAPVYDLITKATGNASVPVLQGSLSGELAARGPLSEFGEISSWTINANLRGKNLSIDDSTPLTIATGPLSLENSQLTAENILLGSPVDPNVRLKASINASLKQTMPISFGLRGDDVPLQTLLSLGSLGSDIPITGKLDVDLSGSGDLNPPRDTPNWEINGRLATPDLMVYGVELGLIEHKLSFNQQRFSNPLAAFLPTHPQQTTAAQPGSTMEINDGVEVEDTGLQEIPYVDPPRPNVPRLSLPLPDRQPSSLSDGELEFDSPIPSPIVPSGS